MQEQAAEQQEALAKAHAAELQSAAKAAEVQSLAHAEELQRMQVSVFSCMTLRE